MEPSPVPVAVPVAALESRRKLLALAAALALPVALGAFAASLVFLKALSPWSEFFPFLWIFVVLAGWFAWQIPWSLVQIAYKDAVAVPAVAAWRPGWTLKPEAGLGKKILAESGLCLQTPDHYFAEDLARGPVDGLAVAVAEVLATRTVSTGSGRGSRSRREVLFQGALGRVSLGSAPWEGRFFLRPRDLTGALASLPGTAVNLSLDPEFEKAFVVTWDGPGTAPDVWDAARRRAVLAVRNELGLKFRLAWDGATLWMGTTSLIDLWEPPLWTRLDDGSRIARSLRPLEAIERLVRALR